MYKDFSEIDQDMVEKAMRMQIGQNNSAQPTIMLNFEINMCMINCLSQS